MPSSLDSDNMSVDENPAPPALSVAQHNFINVVCSRSKVDLPLALGALVREKFPQSKDLNDFIDNISIGGSPLRPSFLALYKEYVGAPGVQDKGDNNAIRAFLHTFATHAGFRSIDEYFASQSKHHGGRTYYLGLGLDSVSNKISDLGTGIRNATSTKSATKTEYNPEAGGGEYELFFSFLSFICIASFLLTSISLILFSVSAQGIPPPQVGAAGAGGGEYELFFHFFPSFSSLHSYLLQFTNSIFSFSTRNPTPTSGNDGWGWRG